jgi:hypothetical protein
MSPRGGGAEEGTRMLYGVTARFSLSVITVVSRFLRSVFGGFSSDDVLALD